MTGFEVYFKDEVILASVNNKGIVAIAVTHEKIDIVNSVSREHITKHIEDVDKIIIKIVDMEQNSEIINSEIISSYINEDIDTYYLNAYFFLKKELEEEGLL
ncbi:MAG: hypothetical protein LBK58_11895 [Prevotellaceae bacterium]|jgi:hypothetical protein|nr:hypothetical protein [Prevotellaceae bacterium]